MLRLSRLAARLAAPRVLPVIYLHSQVLYVSAVSLALALFAALVLGFVQGAAPLVLVSIAYSALAAWPGIPRPYQPSWPGQAEVQVPLGAVPR